ncbi:MULTISPECIES: HAMP domain-containing sensor histidine kinase [unclassified Nitratiruptor]|uniref:sensor histidine kinase n=1 Tax=unclassified Nitratiruptor TaxID=2624044 RepID=UPI0019152507|nr:MULTISPECIES: HAMP domain-containing sensor histidine kinase [unclassified Nitratiruptor]BCD60386.1 two-component system, OmpR family, sensor kinase [Nitratiruptor sp. YY08-10]
MSLSRSEQKALFRFFLTYIIAVGIVITSFAYLQYNIKKESLKDKIVAKLQKEAFDIASSAIDAQMQGKRFATPKGVDFLLLDKNKKFIKGTFKEKIPLDHPLYHSNDCIYYIDKSAKGHLGIEYIVVKECGIHAKYQKILKNIILLSLLYFLFLLGIGWYLGRLFLQPMRESLETLDRFIKDSTHELNTPVTTLLLATQKLKKTNNPKYLDIIIMSARLLSSIHQDLTYATLAKRRDNHIQPIDIVPIINDILRFFDVLIDQKGLTVSKELHACTIQADPDEIKLLVKNLIDNAIKYAFKNSTIKIVLHKCRLSIINRSKPIPNEKLKTIFERYQRAESDQGGYGIGLHIVQRICKKYKFLIGVESNEKKTTFTVTFNQSKK